jgi:hypothetical protein
MILTHGSPKYNKLAARIPAAIRGRYEPLRATTKR